MKVLSLLQPWATLVVMGAKRIETRSWDLSAANKELLFGQTILIHASLGKHYGTGANKVSCRELCYRDPFKKYIAGGLGYDKLPTGAIIGSVNMIGTFETNIHEDHFDNKYTIHAAGHRKWVLTEQEKSFGDYSPGRFGWLLSDPILFATPIPAKGSLGLWEFDMPDHIHVPNKYGGHATFGTPPTKEILNAVNEMADLVYKHKKS